MASFAYVTKSLLEGFGTSVLLFVLTLVLSIPLGLIVCFGSLSKFKPLKYLTKTFIWILRGTPLMLQIMVVYYLPGFLGFKVGDRFTSGLIAFAINYAAYYGEIFRGGIEGIPKGQFEAGMVLGMTKWQVFKKVILIQVIKSILPAMSNEIITLVKDTSLIRIISVAEIIGNAKDLVAATSAIWPLFYTGVFFLIFNGLVTVALAKIEKKLSYFG